MIVAVDVDEVCAQLNKEWLHRYNHDYGDTLTPDDLTEWDLCPAVKRECGARIYDYLRQPDLYTYVEPYPDAHAGIRALRKNGHRVLFATSCVEGSFDTKHRWLVRHGFLPSGKVGLKDFFPVSDKSLIRADVLVDDYAENLRGFPGRRVLVDRPHNRRQRDYRTIDAVVSGLGYLPYDLILAAA